jgi:hypothetical protein
VPVRLDLPQGTLEHGVEGPGHVEAPDEPRAPRVTEPADEGSRGDVGAARRLQEEAQPLDPFEGRREPDLEHGPGPLVGSEPSLVLPGDRHRDALDEGGARDHASPGGHPEGIAAQVAGHDVDDLVEEHRVGPGADLQVDLVPPGLGDVGPRGPHEPTLLGGVAEEEGGDGVGLPDPEARLRLAHAEIAVLGEAPGVLERHLPRDDGDAAIRLHPAAEGLGDARGSGAMAQGEALALEHRGQEEEGGAGRRPKRSSAQGRPARPRRPIEAGEQEEPRPEHAQRRDGAEGHVGQADGDVRVVERPREVPQEVPVAEHGGGGPEAVEAAAQRQGRDEEGEGAGDARWGDDAEERADGHRRGQGQRRPEEQEEHPLSGRAGAHAQQIEDQERGRDREEDQAREEGLPEQPGRVEGCPAGQARADEAAEGRQDEPEDEGRLQPRHPEHRGGEDQAEPRQEAYRDPDVQGAASPQGKIRRGLQGRAPLPGASRGRGEGSRRRDGPGGSPPRRERAPAPPRGRARSAPGRRGA